MSRGPALAIRVHTLKFLLVNVLFLVIEIVIYTILVNGIVINVITFITL